LDFERLKSALDPALALAVTLTPAVPSRAGYVASEDPLRTSRRPLPFAADLDASLIEKSLPEFDRVLAAVHDVAVAAFQHWIDRLSGRVANSFDENTSLARFVNDLAEQFGLGLYLKRGDYFRRVSLSVEKYPTKEKVLPALKLVGKFVAGAINDESDVKGTARYGNGNRLRQGISFPPLVVARTVSEAWASFKEREGGTPKGNEPQD